MATDRPRTFLKGQDCIAICSSVSSLAGSAGGLREVAWEGGGATNFDRINASISIVSGAKAEPTNLSTAFAGMPC
jgi:hypothetical protein